MTKITDQNLLADLQNKRLKLHDDLKSYHTEHEKTWSAENDATFSKMETEYDAVYSQLEGHMKACDAEATSAENTQRRMDKLNSMAGHGNRFNAHQKNIIIGGGGDLGTGRDGKIRDGVLKGMTTSQVGALAFAAWLSGRGDAQAQAACQHLNFNPAAREIKCGLLDTGDFIPLQNAVRGGRTDEILNSLGSNVGTTGGYLFGTTFVNRLEIAMISASGLLEAADVIRTETGEEMRWPTADDTSNKGRQIGEAVAVTDLDPTFGNTLWYAHKFTSDMIKVPHELLQDNAVGLENVIPQMLGERLGRIINEKGTTGNGASTMFGIVTKSTTGKTAAGAAAIVFDEIIDLEHSVGRAIRANRAGCSYMFNDTSLKLIRKLKDGENRYLWQVGTNTGEPDTLNKYRYVINDDMADPASGAKSILFGRLSSYKLRMVGEVRFRRLAERYAESDQEAFVAFVRADGNLLDAGDHPVKALLHP